MIREALEGATGSPSVASLRLRIVDDHDAPATDKPRRGSETPKSTRSRP
jgi:hypothetical protein